MPQKGSQSVTLKTETITTIEFLRERLGKRSWPEVIEYMAAKEMRKFR